MMKIVSFSFKGGLPAPDMLSVDCRKLPNPHWEDVLRTLDGRDPLVQAWILKRAQEAVTSILEGAEKSLELAAEGEKVIAFGCYGGRHRSVAVAEMLANRLREKGHKVEVEHRQLAA